MNERHTRTHIRLNSQAEAVSLLPDNGAREPRCAVPRK